MMTVETFTLKSILDTISRAVSELHAASIIYFSAKYLHKQFERRNAGVTSFPVDSLSSIIVFTDGFITILPSVECPPAERETELLQSLGLTVFSALEFRSSETHPIGLSPFFEELLLRMTTADDNQITVEVHEHFDDEGVFEDENLGYSEDSGANSRTNSEKSTVNQHGPNCDKFNLNTVITALIQHYMPTNAGSADAFFQSISCSLFDCAFIVKGFMNSLESKRSLTDYERVGWRNLCLDLLDLIQTELRRLTSKPSFDKYGVIISQLDTITGSRTKWLLSIQMEFGAVSNYHITDHSLTEAVNKIVDFICPYQSNNFTRSNTGRASVKRVIKPDLKLLRTSSEEKEDDDDHESAPWHSAEINDTSNASNNQPATISVLNVECGDDNLTNFGHFDPQIMTSSNNGLPVDCLCLSLPEVMHIRAVLAKVEIEQILFQCRELHERLVKGKLCHCCHRTQFRLLGFSRPRMCKFCSRKVCKSCFHMSIVPKRFPSVPVYALIPSSSPPIVPMNSSSPSITMSYDQSSPTKSAVKHAASSGTVSMDVCMDCELFVGNLVNASSALTGIWSL